MHGSRSRRVRAAFKAPKPAITADPISYGNDRKRQMARYSKRHYGKREWRLAIRTSSSFTSPRPTATAPSGTRSTRTRRASGESPGICSHYVIQQDGTIDQLVSPSIRCRHTIGLNQTSIGIEMVQATGRGAHWADQQILERRKQVGAALRLVRWLQDRYDIPAHEVIGHSMANDDRYFKDLEGWLNDHTDWLKRDVKEFSSRL